MELVGVDIPNTLHKFTDEEVAYLDLLFDRVVERNGIMGGEGIQSEAEGRMVLISLVKKGLAKITGEAMEGGMNFTYTLTPAGERMVRSLKAEVQANRIVEAFMKREEGLKGGN